MAENDIRLAGVHVEINNSTGQAMKIDPFVYPEFERNVEI
jgi:hypothetical protein